MLLWILFGMISLLILGISSKSLRDLRSHGFYRFFAWESMLALFVINMSYWFYQPFAWNQIIAWALLILSLIPLVLGVHSLRAHGKPAEEREGDASLLAFEKTTTMVTSGVYHYIRHPLYSSLFLLTWGIFFKHLSLLSMLLAITATIFLLATAKADEMECTHFFGAPYQAYMKKTKRFVPYIY